MRRHTISLSTFRNAFVGIYTAVITQVNMRIHFMIATLVFILSVWLKISLDESLIIILTVSTVLIAEMFNTAIEYLSDTVTLEQNQGIKHAKDIAAGGVLFAALFSIIIGILIFVPKIINLVK